MGGFEGYSKLLGFIIAGSFIASLAVAAKCFIALGNRNNDHPCRLDNGGNYRDRNGCDIDL